METALARKAAQLANEGWTITSLTSEVVMGTRKKPMNGLVMALGIIGLLFAIIPGLLILLVGYVARGQESIVVTAAEAEAEEARPRREPKEWDGKGYCPDCGRDTGHMLACPRYGK
jgi:hypothetical protein